MEMKSKDEAPGRSKYESNVMCFVVVAAKIIYIYSTKL